MLGIGDQLTYDESSVYLCKDDILLMVTDGVTEARSVRGDFLGSEGITRLLNNIPKEWNSHQTVAQLDFAISQYTSGSYRDDLAMLLLKRTD
jgi:sigma-B regulation protein RsbU (phosphoserine phosphatase)